MAPQPAHLTRDARAEAERDESFRDSISTVDRRGKRIWIYPKKPSGKWTKRRQGLAYALLALLFARPFLRIGGEPLLMWSRWASPQATKAPTPNWSISGAVSRSAQC